MAFPTSGPCDYAWTRAVEAGTACNPTASVMAHADNHASMHTLPQMATSRKGASYPASSRCLPNQTKCQLWRTQGVQTCCSVPAVFAGMHTVGTLPARSQVCAHLWQHNLNCLVTLPAISGTHQFNTARISPATCWRKSVALLACDSMGCLRHAKHMQGQDLVWQRVAM